MTGITVNSKRETENQSAYYEVSHVSGARKRRGTGIALACTSGRREERDIDGD